MKETMKQKELGKWKLQIWAHSDKFYLYFQRYLTKIMRIQKTFQDYTTLIQDDLIFYFY